MKIKLTNEIESVCGRFILPVDCELDVTDTDEQRGVYEASYNDGFFVIPFQCAEAIIEPVLVDKKTKEQNQRPFKIKIIKILPGMDHSGIDLGDELYPITWENDCYGVEVNSVRWLIPKDAAEVIETRPVEKSVLDQFQYNDDGRLEPINKELLTEEKRPLNSISVGLDPQIIAGGLVWMSRQAIITCRTYSAIKNILITTCLHAHSRPPVWLLIQK